MRQFQAMLWMAIVASVLLPSASRAQVPDHLKCYKIKDSVAKATYTADLGGLAPEPGCLVKVPGKLLCVETTKTNVSPTPPGAPAGPAAGQFLCYKVKCPKGVSPVVTLVDQFGTHTVTPSAAQLLCAPAQAPPPTTTTTTNPAGTTTTTPTTTTTSTTLACGATGTPCSSNSDCCSGLCNLGAGPHVCLAAPTTTTTTSTTTTTVPCPGGGALVGGFCWYAGSVGESCDSACAGVGKTCDPATVTYAGTGGTSANCGAVVTAFGGGSVYGGDDHTCGTGAGCVAEAIPGLSSAQRCTDVPTTCSAIPPTVPGGVSQRFCACM